MTTALRILNPIVSRIFGPPVDVDDVQARHDQQEHEQHHDRQKLQSLHDEGGQEWEIPSDQNPKPQDRDP